MYNIQTLNKISAVGTQIFDTGSYSVADSPENPDAILVRSAAMHDMEFQDNLLAVARAGAGVNNIPIDKCSEKGICVFNTPGANANAVKELVIAGLLLSSRKVTDAVSWVSSIKNEGDQIPKLVEKGKSQFAGPEIAGKTLGIIGLGAIGVLVANAALELGMKVVGCDPFLSVKSALQLSPKIQCVACAENVYKEADYITVHVPYNAETKGFINADVLASFKDGARILNFARGELVDDDAMLAAIESGKVSCYVTDFPNAKLVDAKGVIAIPHLGASTPESEDNCAVMAVNQLIDYIENGNIKNSVNLPDAEMDAVGTKICIIHKNIPSIIAKITSVLGDNNLNIENMLNRSKKDYAYTMIDACGGSISDDVTQKLYAIEGVIRVRII